MPCEAIAKQNNRKGVEEINAITVTQVNEYIKALLDASTELSDIYILGEISNFTNHRTGHYYFSLKDEGGVLRCVMFKYANAKLKFLPENGMRVVARGRISAFPRDGQYQLYCEGMEPDGVGSLYIAYEQLKSKLEAEGLFDASLKKPIPRIPSVIGIITSPTGAAVRDMINIASRRYPAAKLVLFPALVQGEGAAAQLATGIKYFSRRQDVDVIIIGRGGGSIEDLWAFNSEGLARAVHACEKPVISAVGHETDFTICDFAADLRAPTPSAAMELALPDEGELRRGLTGLRSRIESAIVSMTDYYRKVVEAAAHSRALSSPAYITQDRAMLVLHHEKQLLSGLKLIYSAKRGQFMESAGKLEAYNPLAVLTRGYAAVFDGSGSVVKSVRSLKGGEDITIRMSDGSVGATVKDK